MIVAGPETSSVATVDALARSILQTDYRIYGGCILGAVLLFLLWRRWRYKEWRGATVREAGFSLPIAFAALSSQRELPTSGQLPGCRRLPGRNLKVTPLRQSIPESSRMESEKYCGSMFPMISLRDGFPRPHCRTRARCSPRSSSVRRGTWRRRGGCGQGRACGHGPSWGIGATRYLP